MAIPYCTRCFPLGYRASAGFPPAHKCFIVPSLSSLLVTSLLLPTLTLYHYVPLPCSGGGTHLPGSKPAFPAWLVAGRPVTAPRPGLAVHLVLHGGWPAGEARGEAGGLLGQPNHLTSRTPPTHRT